MKAHRFFRSVLLVVVALLVLAQLFVSAKCVAENFALISENPNRTYDEKMQARWRSHYELIQFVQNETPRQATLWIDSSSHVNLDLYFLYPRRVLYGGDLASRMQSVDYLVLTGASPIPAIQGEKKMLDEKRGLIKLRP